MMTIRVSIIEMMIILQA